MASLEYTTSKDSGGNTAFVASKIELKLFIQLFEWKHFLVTKFSFNFFKPLIFVRIPFKNGSFIIYYFCVYLIACDQKLFLFTSYFKPYLDI